VRSQSEKSKDKQARMVNGNESTAVWMKSWKVPVGCHQLAHLWLTTF
jgi:hypothetical protein